MLYLTIALFALAAVAGLVILKNWLTAANTSRTVIYAHGLVAAAALVLLLVQALRNPGGSLRLSLLLFALAAIGGFYLFLRDVKGRMSPLWVAFTHAAVAVSGFVVLLLVVF